VSPRQSSDWQRMAKSLSGFDAHVQEIVRPNRPLTTGSGTLAIRCQSEDWRGDTLDPPALA